MQGVKVLTKIPLLWVARCPAQGANQPAGECHRALVSHRGLPHERDAERLVYVQGLGVERFET